MTLSQTRVELVVSELTKSDCNYENVALTLASIEFLQHKGPRYPLSRLDWNPLTLDRCKVISNQSLEMKLCLRLLLF